MKIEIPEQLITDGYIMKKKHPTEELYIYCYTPKTQYEGNWNEFTRMCRGLILDGENNIVARPFPKFFNYEELLAKPGLGTIPMNERFMVYDKVDGSLGILYTIKDKYYIATKGSFVSEQAIRATEIFNKKYPKIKLDLSNTTHLFEIIYPENRVVVDYESLESLILLATLDDNTGMRKVTPDVFQLRATVYPRLCELSLLEIRLGCDSDFREGYVIEYESGFRLKMKFKEYLRLHKILTNTSSRTIWEALSGKGDTTIESLLETVPDEFYNWVKKTREDLENQFDNFLKEAKWIFNIIQRTATDRKSFANYAQQHGKLYIPVLFSMLDGDKERVKEYIWKQIKPERTLPFKEEV